MKEEKETLNNKSSTESIFSEKGENASVDTDVTQTEDSDKEKSFTQKWEESPYWVVSGSYKVLHSIWMVFMAVGMFLAWLIALLAT